MRSFIIGPLVLGMLLLGACGKKDEAAVSEKSSGQERASLAKTAATEDVAIDLKASVLSAVPDSALGFFYTDTQHAAFKKYQSSAWGASSSYKSMLESSSPEVKKYLEILKKAKLDPTDDEILKTLFTEVAGFVIPAQGSIAGGVVFRSGAEDLKPRVEVTFNELKKLGENVKEVAIADGFGFSIVAKPNADSPTATAEPVPFIVAVKKNMGVVASTEELAKSVLAETRQSLPAIANTEQFKQAMKGLPSKDVRYSFAYGDLKALLAATQGMQAAGGASVPQETAGMQAFAGSQAMLDYPRSDLKLIYDPKLLAADSMLKSLSQSSIGSIAGAVSSKPLMLLTIDGKTLANLKGIAQAQLGDAGKMLAVLDGINRLGVLARVAAPGQSMLPVPDLLFVAEAKDAAKTSKEVEEMAKTMLQGQGLGEMPWSESDVQGVKVKSMMSPLGVGVFIASSKNLVLLSSSESQLRETLTLKDNAAFSKSLTAASNDMMMKQDSVGSLYLNFVEVASLLENMGGLLSMYAPPQDGAPSGDLLQPEQIKSLKAMGSMVATVKLEPQAIAIETTYQPAS